MSEDVQEKIRALHPMFESISACEAAEKVTAVLDFCLAWNAPIQLNYKGKKLVLMPYDTYLDRFCTPEEREQLLKSLK